MRMMERRWLLARRDALIDRALTYALVPVALGAMTALQLLPLPVVTGLGGMGAGLCLGAIKKPEFGLE